MNRTPRTKYFRHKTPVAQAIGFAEDQISRKTALIKQHQETLEKHEKFPKEYPLTAKEISRINRGIDKARAEIEKFKLVMPTIVKTADRQTKKKLARAGYTLKEA